MIRYSKEGENLQFFRAWMQSDHSVVIQEGSVGKTGSAQRFPFTSSEVASEFMWKAIKDKPEFSFLPEKKKMEFRIKLRSQDEIGQIEEQLSLHESLGYLLEDTGNGELGDGKEVKGEYHITAEVVDFSIAQAQIKEELNKQGYKYNF